MEFKVFIFSNDVLEGHFKFDFDKFKIFCINNLIEIKSFAIESFDLNRQFLENDKNLIIFCNNEDIDKLIIKNIQLLGSNKNFIDEQIVVFNKESNKIIFVPLESDIELLDKAFAGDDNKKTCQFHVFGLKKEEIKQKLEKLRQEIDGFEYKYSYDNLISDIVMTYNGQTSLIDDNQVKIATEFKQFLFSENDMTLPEIVSRMLNLKGKTISICENVTKGKIIYTLLRANENFKDVLKTVKFDEYELLNADILYDKTINFLKDSKADIAVMTNGNFSEDGLTFNFVIADSSEVHIYKNTFKANKESCIDMAVNSLFFHLVKKLRQNDLTY